MPAGTPNKFTKIVRRFLVPQFVVTLYYLAKARTMVSHRAEVELSPLLTFGRGCVVGSFTKIKATEGEVIIGAQSGIATSCFIGGGDGGIHIGDHFICGPNVNIIASNYVIEDATVPVEQQGSVSKGIRIGSNVWVGAGCTILDGAVIGDNTVVVANSLVNRRYPPNSIVQGSPAKVIMRRKVGDKEE